ncbi:MAG TPA: twin-arginine translocase subunit TatC [Sedimentisphaerales bacterium]|jgi:sec-independent protein translocase protein TatC|nr:twin-arginine translocase subunit TatC [Sedimentisphaerales bacterium]HNU28273.1 twin-arginine translocase subunit TatC [Sedimentisphaerales bacterium]
MVKIRKNLDPSQCTMSLGDHLEELRARLILAILGLAIGAVVSMVFGTHILSFIERPYVKAMGKWLEGEETPRIKSEMTAFTEVFFRTLTANLDPNAPQLDPSRVEFFRKVSLDAVEAWIKETRAAAGNHELPTFARLQTLAPAEAFVAYMKVSFIAGLILTSPWVFYQIWMFVAVGLYPAERKYVHTAIPFSTALFVIGAMFFLFVIAPLTLGFFLKFGDIVGTASNWTLQRYISFVTVLMLVFGIAFQTPIAIFILVRTGLVSIATLRRVRTYVILGIFIVAAIATPPDVVSQISLAIPLYALYELGIVLALFAEKKAKEKMAETTSG